MTRLLLDAANMIGLGCWCVCFWWMHRISSRQDAVLTQLQKQSERIEKISREEHAILNELHPNVEAIQKEVGVVSEKVARVEDNVGEQRTTSAASTG
jgi:hypothetical protein